ncbi:MAG TPA: cyanophycin synthetase [Pirellulales bacterium]|nr:cyanophycin synthetase [Pirellulales bacterium]
MIILKVLALRGPNVWANFPVLEAWVELGELRDSPSDQLPGFNERLMAWLPSMIEHRCSIGERGGFFERLRRGTYQAHILEHVTIELQTLAGTEVGFGRARETAKEGTYKVVVEYEDESIARACLAEAHELCLAAVYDRTYDIEAAVSRLRELNQEVRLGPSTRAIVDAAKARGIPWRRLSRGSLIQFGHGAKQRRILASETDRTGAIAESIAQDKDLTRSMLRAVGVPVPTGRPVESADDAWEAAREIGTPVVVKPQFGNQGRGVATCLTTCEQVHAAYEAARREGSSIVVERHLAGADFRLLVVGHRLVAAARREPAQVVGDGRHTVAELVDQINADPRRGNDHATPLSKIRLDPIAMGVLAEQGLAPTHVPPAGCKVLIRRNGNLSTGGSATDVTDLVHPEVAARAVEAARVVGLDVAGVDVIAMDISRSLEDQGGGVVEVNAAPGLRMHVEPSLGKPRPVGEAIVASLFAEGRTGRIPIVSITGTNGKTTTTRFIAHLFRSRGHTVGMTSTDGIFIDGRRIDTGDCSGPQSARAVLLNPKVEAAVLETARGGILREGLGFDRCDVAVVTNIAGGDHLGTGGIDTLEDLAKVKRVPVEAVSSCGTAVLKADDPLVAQMASRCPGSVIFFARSADDPVIAAHRAAGKRAVFVRDDTIVAAEGDHETPLVPLARVPLTHGGRVGFQVENALATAAAGWAVGFAFSEIQSGMESFASKLDQVPGRFNLLEIGDAAVIVDYGHNSSALAALIEVVGQFPHPKRSIVYSAAGDRRDCDLIEQGEMLGAAFDRVVLYEDHYLRGRADGEIMALFRQGLIASPRTVEVLEIRGALKAVEQALELVRPGELLVIQADVIDETVDFIKRYVSRRVPGREIDLAEAIEALPAAGVGDAGPTASHESKRRRAVHLVS